MLKHNRSIVTIQEQFYSKTKHYINKCSIFTYDYILPLCYMLHFTISCCCFLIGQDHKLLYYSVYYCMWVCEVWL